MYHHHPYTVDYGVGSVAPPQFSYDWNYNNYAMSAPNYAGMPLYSSYPGGGRGGVGNQCKYNKGENNYIFFHSPVIISKKQHIPYWTKREEIFRK